jgi:hypothetical protein
MLLDALPPDVLFSMNSTVPPQIHCSAHTQKPPPQHNVQIPPLHPASHPLPPGDDTDLDNAPPADWWKVRPSTPLAFQQESDGEVNYAFGDIDEDGFQDIYFAGAAIGTESDPRTCKLAMKSKDADKWRQAADEEMTSLTNNDTWDVVDLPRGQEAINSGWVFKLKQQADGSIEQHKGRVVAKGCGQCPGINYNEVFAPTFCPAALRLILAIPGIEDMELHSVDITSAFPNGDLE